MIGLILYFQVPHSIQAKKNLNHREMQGGESFIHGYEHPESMTCRKSRYTQLRLKIFHLHLNFKIVILSSFRS